MAGMALRAMLQVGLVVLLTRSMGAKGYGEFIATLAVVSLFAPLAGVGGAVLLVRDTAREAGAFPSAFGRALLMLVLTGPPLAILAAVSAWLILPHEISLVTILALAGAEVLCTPALELAARAYQGHERVGRMITLTAGLVLARLLVVMGAGAVVSLNAPSAALAYLVAGVAAAGGALAMTATELGRPSWSWRKVPRALREGVHFGIGGAAFRVHSEIDKAMLARLDNLASAGVYSAGFRFVQMAMLPVGALIEAAVARFFQAGREGLTATARMAWRLLPLPLAYVLGAGIALFLGAALLPWLLGSDFQSAVAVVQWLAPLPLVLLLRYGLGTLAAVSSRQRLSGWAMVIGATTNVLLNLWLIPAHGWKGAVVATYSAEALMILVLLGGLAVWRDLPGPANERITAP